MNASKNITLFGILFLSVEFASQKLSRKDLELGLRDVITGDGSETLEQVKVVFENADEHFNNDFEGIIDLYESNNPEVVQYVLSKSVNMDPKKRAEKIREILLFKMIQSGSESLRAPGDPAYEIVMTCLDEMKDDGYASMNEILSSQFWQFIMDGNLSLVKKFVEAGFKVSEFSGDILRIKNNTVETINYLVENGYDINKHDFEICQLIQSKKISLSDFKLYLDHGLPLDYDFGGFNWLAMALEAGDLDMAEFLYTKKGLRLSKNKLNGHVYFEFQNHIQTLIHRLAMSAAFEAAKMMYSGNIVGQGNLDVMPKDMIHEMVKAIYEVKIDQILDDLYH